LERERPVPASTTNEAVTERTVRDRQYPYLLGAADALADMTTTPASTDLLAAAVTAGLVTGSEVTSGDVTVRGDALLLRGRAIAYAAATDPTNRQLRCLQQLADGGLVPAVLRGTPRGAGNPDGIAWFEAVRGTRLSALRGTMAELAEACQAWGGSLAALHLSRIAPGGEPPVAPRPWVLDPDRLPRGMRQAAAGSARSYVLRTLLSDRGLLRTTTRVADRWGADHWTHGEPTADRVLVQELPELRVRFVDLRFGGLGDAAWDLAGALETIAELTSGRRAPWGSASGACLSEYLVQGYRRSGGTAAADSGTRALRIVTRAWEDAVALDARAAHPASMHPAAGQPDAAARLTERLAQARELAARSARPGLVAA